MMVSGFQKFKAVEFISSHKQNVVIKKGCFFDLWKEGFRSAVAFDAWLIKKSGGFESVGHECGVIS